MNPERILLAVLGFVLAIGLVHFCTGCSPATTAATVDDAAYEKDLVACREASKGRPDACPFYVECRKGVASRYGRKFSGVCTEGDK